MLTESWDKYLIHFADEQKDIYFTEAYVRAQAVTGDSPVCFVFNEHDNYFLCVFLKRRVSWLAEEIYDVETPYGYGGPITNSPDPDFALRAAKCMAEELCNAGVIAAFLRFHPLMDNQKLLNGQASFDVIPERETAVMNLLLSEEELRREHLHAKHRNAISQAQRAGLSFYIDSEWKYLEVFGLLYESTMNRIDADEFYYFHKAYFEDMKQLSPQAFLGVVLKDNRCIAAAIFLHSGIYGHYHLSASDSTKQILRPNNFMIYEAALYLKKQGAHWFHLGGAPNSVHGSSLFQFKSRFTKLKRDFFIGKAVLNRPLYDAVCSHWVAKYPEKQDRYGQYVLKYRF